MKGAIGLIANPASGKDIRRIVAYGTTADNVEKINHVRRIILGACSQNVTDIFYMPDYFNIAESAVNGIYEEHKYLIKNLKMHKVPMFMAGQEIDSTVAASKMKELGAEAVIVLGGDGTSRAVAKEIGDVPIIVISTGTNNVFPRPIEGTVAGMAAGAYAAGMCSDNVLQRTKRIEVYRNGIFEDIALIDAVVVKNETIGSRAIWKTDNIGQIFLTCCEADSIGISAIGGRIVDIVSDDCKGLYIETGDSGEKVTAPIAPGLISEIGIKKAKILNINETIKLEKGEGVIAFDGERNFEFFERDKIELKLTWNGPLRLDIKECLRQVRSCHGNIL